MLHEQILEDADILSVFFEECNVAYLITDESLCIRRIYDPARLLSPVSVLVEGANLLQLAPELFGNEQILTDISNGKEKRIQIDLVNRVDENGDTHYLRILLRPRFLKGDSIAGGLMCLIEDVTDVGRIQQGLMQSRNELLLLRDALDAKNRELTASNLELRKQIEMNTSFVSIAAHELRTPLAIIRGYADMLLDEALGGLVEPQREGLTILRESADRLLEIVTNLLDLARLEAGRIELVMQPLDLGALVQATAREFRPLFQNANQQLTVIIAPDLPAALCDETRAFQILGNLLSNASKYTPRDGQIDLRVDLMQESGEIQVSVHDNGIGIPADEQARMGDLFFRARTADMISTYGVGMGLNITRSLVQLHGGRFWFESEEGNGSTFYATFLLANPTES